MKLFAILLAGLFIGTVAMFQQPGGNNYDVFAPLSLTKTSQGALTGMQIATDYADTTKSIDVRDYHQVFLTITESISDTMNLHVYYRGSNDGINYTTGTTSDAWTFMDSINWKPSTNNQLFRVSFLVPEKAMGYKTVQFKMHCPGTVPLGGTTTGSTYPKVSYEVVRKFRK